MVSGPVHAKWYDFLYDKFIPTLENEPMIEKILLARVLGEEVQDHLTYSLQMFVPEISYYTRLRGGLFKDYQSTATELFKTDVNHFFTVMKVLK